MFGNNFGGPIIRSSFTLPRILNGLSKTLGVVNQALPLYRQAKPMIKKGQTLFKMAKEMTKTSVSSKPVSKPKTLNNTEQKNISLKRNASLNKPIFFQ